MNNLNWILLFLAFAVGQSCDGADSQSEARRGHYIFRDENGQPNEVILVGTSAYAEWISKARVTPGGAKDNLVQYQRSQGTPIFIGDQFVIVNGEYVFGKPSKLGISLEGYYVHGESGAVRYVMSLKELLWRDHPEWHELAGKPGLKVGF